MVAKFNTRPVKVDQFGHQIGGGMNPQNDINQANIQQANRVLAFADTGRLSSSGGNARVSEFLAVPAMVDVDVATDTIGSTKATVDASLALVNDGLDAVIADANSLAVILGIDVVTYAGGGTAASPIAAITDAGTVLTTSAPAADMNPIRIDINTNMHVAGAMVNKIMRVLRLPPVDIEFSPDRQPPPDTYGAGSTGTNPPGTDAGSGGGSGVSFGVESPFVTTTPAITETSGTHASPAVTGAVLDAAFTVWRDNIETLATRLAVATNTIVVLTDSTTGAVTQAMVAITAFPADTAEVGTTLAGGVTTDAEMDDIRDGIASLWSKANELAAGLGVQIRVYDGAGAIANTLVAIGAVTAVTTGVIQSAMEAWRVDMEETMDALAEFVNVIAGEVDVTPIARVEITASFPFDNPVNPLQEKSGFNDEQRALSRWRTSQQDPSPGSVIAVTGGTPADPGQLKTDVDISFALAADNLATLAAKINAIRTALAAPLVKLV